VTGLYGHLTFVFPCIVSVITIDNQHDATILISLFLISSTCFRRCFLPSPGTCHCNYNFCYCPPMLLLAGVAYWVKFSSTQYATSGYGDCFLASRQPNLYDINFWIPSPSRAVSRFWDELMVGRPNRRIQSSFIVVSGSRSRAPSSNR